MARDCLLLIKTILCIKSNTLFSQQICIRCPQNQNNLWWWTWHKWQNKN